MPILCDEGTSGWGWKQNALVRVDSNTSSVIYTPEYYAVKHFSNRVVSGTKILQYKEKGEDKLPVMVFLTPDNKFLVVAGNFNDTPRQLTVQIKNRTGEKKICIWKSIRDGWQLIWKTQI